ncbi:hypothetical protein DFJ73DRAFT_760641 [Zopfochytrium polystomum]|nr:hypothetical protein DFJ73DRAFT_760641 [Zopfochytrium polystomum]
MPASFASPAAIHDTLDTIRDTLAFADSARRARFHRRRRRRRLRFRLHSGCAASPADRDRDEDATRRAAVSWVARVHVALLKGAVAGDAAEIEAVEMRVAEAVASGAAIGGASTNKTKQFSFPPRLPAPLQISELSYTAAGLGWQTWGCAVLLSQLIANSRETVTVAGATVLELGCGTGLAGIAAARCGARRVWLTDGSEAAVRNAGENARRNGCAVVRRPSGSGGGGSADAAEDSSSVEGEVLLRVLDWSRFAGGAGSPASAADETTGRPHPQVENDGSEKDSESDNDNDGSDIPSVTDICRLGVDVVIAADVCYEIEHGPLVAGMLEACFRAGAKMAFVVVALRRGFEREVEGFERCVAERGIATVESRLFGAGDGESDGDSDRGDQLFFESPPTAAAEFKLCAFSFPGGANAVG